MSTTENENHNKIILKKKEMFHKMHPADILKHFNQTEKGYTQERAEELQKAHGLNELEEEEKESIFEKIIEQFQDNLVRILLFAACISFVIALTDGSEGISAYIEPLVILLILIANAAIGIIQDINADNAIDALKKDQQCNCLVFRNGELTKIDSKYLVPGDIVQLVEGEKVPADVQLIDIRSITFQVDQSTMTGETEPKYKDLDPVLKDEVEISQLHNTAFSSTGVTTGVAIGIVIYTGMNTQIGNVQKMVKEGKESEESSPLKKKIEEFGDYLTYIIGVICLVVWVINYKNFFDEVHGNWISGCIYYFKISVALAVAAIPEGLPAVITTCLALGTTRLSKHKAIIKKLHSIETLGCTSVICSDKTGTLTTNNMTITKCLILTEKAFTNKSIFNITGSSFNPQGEISNYTESIASQLKLHNECASINNLSKLTLDDKTNKYSVIGTPTEGALRVLVEKLSQYDKSYTAINHHIEAYNKFLLDNYEIVYTLEFDRKRKSKSVIAIDKRTNKPILFIKGAVEYLIKKSKSIQTSIGELALNDQNKAQLSELITENFMKQSLRTLALSFKLIYQF